MMLPTSSSTDVEDENELKMVQTSQSVRDRRAFEPVRSGDKEELQRIATTFGESVALARTKSHATTGGLQKQDTLANLEFGDPVLDPSSPEFDVYKWTRMLVSPRSDRARVSPKHDCNFNS
jgi:ATP-binding cassette subfamily G (WHITE) protein 2 (PDR)